jgi:membrane associated rhomboid family serine protease
VIQVRVGAELVELSWDVFEERVRAGRIPPEAEIRWEPVTGAQFVRADELETYRSLRDERVTSWQRDFGQSAAPLATALLVGVQLRLWALSLVPSHQRWLELHLTKWTPFTLENGEVWRLVTMGFLHTDPIHLTMNMLWMAYTSWNLERALGWRNLVALYLTSVVGGALLSTWGAPESPSLGASGGVFGLIAASVVFGLQYPDMLPERSRRFFGFAMLPYLLVMFLSGLFNASTDNWCHLGGLLTGAALATRLVPPAFEPAPGHNTRVHLRVATAIAATFAGLAFAGPTLTAVQDVDEVRLAQLHASDAAPPLDPDRYRELQFDVPLGWIAGATLDRTSGYRSPAGPRAWAVRVATNALPTNAVKELQDRRDQLEDLGAVITRWEVDPSEVAGTPGLIARATLSYDDQEIVGTWQVATRGRHVLHVIWQVEAEAADHLAPLAGRLLDSVVWQFPEELTAVEGAWTANPNNGPITRRFAEELAEVGRVEEALARWMSLIESAPRARRPWEGLLQLLTWYPDATPELDALLERALAADAGATVDLGVVTTLEARGEASTARALLDLAWARSPGDRTLRAARRSREMSVVLDPSTQLPAGSAWDVLTRRPRPASLRTTPPTLAEARQYAQVLASTHDALLQRAATERDASDPGLAATLLMLAHGHPIAEPEQEFDALLIALRGPEAPWWWSTSATELLGDRDTLADLLEAQPREQLLTRIPGFGSR